MKELENLADSVRTQLKLEYDAESIKYVEQFIEQQKARFDENGRTGLINSLGSFLGQSIIENYGGQWELDEELQAMCIAFSDSNKVYPFAKTAKQFENGLEDSIYSFFTVIPIVFKLNK